MYELFTTYLQKLQKTSLHEKTEHTDRLALQQLLETITKHKNNKIKVVHEPRRNKEGFGSPDFMIKMGESIIGYLENKQIGESLDKILKSDQITKYKKLSNNILLTNYLEFVWIHEDEIQRETLCYIMDIENKRFKASPDKMQNVERLIESFFSQPPKGIGKAKHLAEALAERSKHLRVFLEEELTRQEKEHKEGRLFGLYETFKTNVFSELTINEFADAFAQMLAYGLFLAKLDAGTLKTITLSNAKTFIPSSFELIRELVQFLDELENDDYRDVKWIVNEILSIMNSLELKQLDKDLSFKRTERHLWKEMDEESQLLFKKDPYVYFYEDFLSKYSPAMRKSKGVYYTPPPVVNFITRAINDVLKNDFGIKEGFADHQRVTVLDFATGTGTFLLEIFEQMFEALPEDSGKFKTLIQDHVLKNFYGFEYLIAPYTIAHLKLSQYLKDQGHELKGKERLQIYLTNTLEPVAPQGNLLLPALSNEGKKAQEIKEQPILVITGNPPYFGHSKNKGEWITQLLKGKDIIKNKKTENYFEVNGQPLGERNPKWLNDDYVKFIRFAQYKMEQVPQGIVGIITNHSYLDNPTFRGMRQSLMRTFNQIYILDLHGNAKKKELCPDGSKDENVFDIEQGVAIALFVKHPNLKAKTIHGDLWGKRKDKYLYCYDKTIKTSKWSVINPTSPSYLFLPQNTSLFEKYNEGISIKDIFVTNSVGVVTAKDKLFISFEKQECREKIKEAFGMIDDSKVMQITYRPFDDRLIYYDTKKIERAREDVMRHMTCGKNLGLIAVRRSPEVNPPRYIFVSDKLIINGTIRSDNQSIDTLFPLYLYDFEKDQRQGNLWKRQDQIENLSKPFREFIDEKYGHHFLPEKILGYIYAILHSPTYRKKYAEFLKSDFPRIPFVDDRKTFEKLSKLGLELMQAHLVKTVPDYSFGIFKGKGSNEVEKTRYTHDKKIWINNDQYFDAIPQNVWEFHIGGYQVIDKYLKSRKERILSLDEITHVEKVIKILAFTIDQMNKIDYTYKHQDIFEI